MHSKTLLLWSKAIPNNQPTYDDIRIFAQSLLVDNRSMRVGEAYMMALLVVDKHLYDKIKGSDVDPSITDNNMREFNFYLAKVGIR